MYELSPLNIIFLCEKLAIYHILFNKFQFIDQIAKKQKKKKKKKLLTVFLS